MMFCVNPVGLRPRYVKELASIFSSDPTVIDLFQECRLEMGLMSLGLEGMSSSRQVPSGPLASPKAPVVLD